MSVALVVALATQAALPPPGGHYFARTEYQGPGLLCGSAFSFRLREGETAQLIKNSAIMAVVTIRSADGEFSVSEHQYPVQGGTSIGKIGEGLLRRQLADGHFKWLYTDRAPGTTEVYGPAVDARERSRAFSRIRFGSPRHAMVDGEKCLQGTSFDGREDQVGRR